MQGPRQGVHLSPQHMQQWRQMHRFVRWRNFQFRDPGATYVYRARIEPRPPQLPTASEPKQHHAAFPSRGHLLKRPSSTSSSRPRSATPTSSGSPSHRPPRPVRTTSTTSLNDTSGTQSQSSNEQVCINTSGPIMPGSAGQLSGSEFTLSATAMSIQPRQPSQRSLATGKTNKQLVVDTASFPYPDPTKFKGDPNFLTRLAELAKLETETVRSEQAKARLMLSARSRPSSARSLRSSAATSGSWNSKCNGSGYTYQSNRRTNVNARGPAAMKRMNSSPAVSAFDRRPNLSASSLSISKQLSCSDLPMQTQTRSRKVNVELDHVKEATSRSDCIQDSGTQLSLIMDTEDEFKVQRSSISTTAGSSTDIEIIEGLGDGAKAQSSCSPPIIYIPAPPIRCSWSVEERESSSAVQTLEEHGLAMSRDSTKIEAKEHQDKNFEDKSTSGDMANNGVSSPNSNQDSTSCQNSHSGNNRLLVEDDLKVTSDLGLSIDSLHLSEDDNNSEPVMSSAVAPSNLSSVDGMNLDVLTSSHDIETGSSSGSRSSKKMPIRIPRTRYGLGETTETKQSTSTKKCGDRKSTKLSHDSSAAQVVASNSSTSLKSNKSVRNSHKTVKKSTKRRIKK